MDGDRRISTRFGLLDVDVRVDLEGSLTATLSKHHPRPAAVDPQAERLRAALKRWTPDPVTAPRPPVRQDL